MLGLAEIAFRVCSESGRPLGRLLATPLGRVRWVYMPDDPKSMHLDAKQCRECAKLVRYTAEAVKSALLRQTCWMWQTNTTNLPRAQKPATRRADYGVLCSRKALI